MAKVDQQFLDFLIAQYHNEAFNMVDGDNVPDTKVNYVMEKYKADFEAWRVIVPPYKDAYGHVKPYMLAEAKKDPNFTPNDMKRVEEQHNQSIDPVSGISKSWYEDPIFNDLVKSGITLTTEHLAKQQLTSMHYQNAGYSYQACQKIALDYVATIALFEKRFEITSDKTLSDEERQKKLAEIDDNITHARLERQKTQKEDCEKNQPEKILMHLLRDYQRKQISEADFLSKVDAYVKRIIEDDRLTMLGVEMSHSLYQKVLKQEPKSVFGKVLTANGISLNQMEQIARDFSHTPLSEQNKPLNTYQDVALMRATQYTRR